MNILYTRIYTWNKESEKLLVPHQLLYTEHINKMQSEMSGVTSV